MLLTKFHQSGFILELDNGFRIAWDIANKTPITDLDSIGAVDLFVVSHIHGDHYSPEHISKLQPDKLISTAEVINVATALNLETIAISHQDVVETDDIKIEFFDVDHGPNVSAPVENVGFLLTLKATGEFILLAICITSRAWM
jgi:L-ascorbate metabolism protein UlaG (beta-lactamase superfamily)